MSIHLYFSLIPEALIASMLPPEEFGQYYATGHKFKSKGQAIFFEVDPAYRHEYFDIDGCFARCVAKPNGAPKNSIYVSMYRVTEHLTVSALGKLYLTTAMGATLGLSRASELPKVNPELHMYQDLAPINSLVVSMLDPAAYYADVTIKPSKSFRFPGMCFVELGLGLRLSSTCAKRCWKWGRAQSRTSWSIGCIHSNSRFGWSRTAFLPALATNSSTTRCSLRRYSKRITATGGVQPICRGGAADRLPKATNGIKLFVTL